MLPRASANGDARSSAQPRSLGRLVEADVVATESVFASQVGFFAHCSKRPRVLRRASSRISSTSATIALPSDARVVPPLHRRRGSRPAGTAVRHGRSPHIELAHSRVGPLALPGPRPWRSRACAPRSHHGYPTSAEGPRASSRPSRDPRETPRLRFRPHSGRRDPPHVRGRRRDVTRGSRSNSRHHAKSSLFASSSRCGAIGIRVFAYL